MTRITTLLILIAGLASCAAKTISEAEARDFAGKALARYCASEKLSPEQFKIKEIGPSEDVPWLIVYESVGIKPAQEVAVTINKSGSVELSFMVEGRDDQ